MSKEDKKIERAISRLNKRPTEANLNNLISLLSKYINNYRKEHGYFPRIHVDMFLISLSTEVINLYKDRLPFNKNI